MSIIYFDIRSTSSIPIYSYTDISRYMGFLMRRDENIVVPLFKQRLRSNRYCLFLKHFDCLETIVKLKLFWCTSKLERVSIHYHCQEVTDSPLFRYVRWSLIKLHEVGRMGFVALQLKWEQRSFDMVFFKRSDWRSNSGSPKARVFFVYGGVSDAIGVNFQSRYWLKGECPSVSRPRRVKQ
jgi:hypothetical protein